MSKIVKCNDVFDVKFWINLTLLLLKFKNSYNSCQPFTTNWKKKQLQLKSLRILTMSQRLKCVDSIHTLIKGHLQTCDLNERIKS